MEIPKSITANIVGTTFMTLFSHIVSDVKEENFSEPNLLSKFLERAPFSIDKNLSKTAGWIGHYLVGAAFTELYVELLKASKTKSSIKKGLLFGVLSGIAGIGTWKTVFKLHPNPPKTPATQFYTQLLLAHVVFGIAVNATLKVLDDAKSQPQRYSHNDDKDPYYPLQDEKAIVSPS